MIKNKLDEFEREYEKELKNLNEVRIHVINSLNRVKEMEYRKNDLDMQLVLYDIDHILNASKRLFSDDEIKCLRLVYEKDGINEKE